MIWRNPSWGFSFPAHLYCVSGIAFFLLYCCTVLSIISVYIFMKAKKCGGCVLCLYIPYRTWIKGNLQLGGIRASWSFMFNEVCLNLDETCPSSCWIFLGVLMLELRSCFQRLQRRGIVFIRNMPAWLGIFNKIGLRKLVLLCVGLFIMFGIYTIWTGVLVHNNSIYCCCSLFCSFNLSNGIKLLWLLAAAFYQLSFW